MECGRSLIHTLDPTTGKVLSTFKFSDPQESQRRMSINAHGLAIDSKGNILICCNRYHAVYVYSPEGELKQKIEGDMKTPMGVAVDPRTDNILVTERHGNRVQVFTSTGEHVRFIGKTSDLKHPHGLVVDYCGSVVVADEGNQCIKIFSDIGQLIMKFDVAPVNVNPSFKLHPSHPMIDHEGNILLRDSRHHQLLIYG